VTFLHILELFNHGLVLLYGVLLSAHIAGGWDTPVQRRWMIGLYPVLLAVQAILWYLFGSEAVRRLYPLITHLPLILALKFFLKKSAGVSVVSVATAYLCCQLPRWVSLAAEALLRSELAGEIAYTLSIVPVFFLLLRWFVRPAASAMTAHRKSLLLFGSLPAAYYLFDYATAVYADWLALDSAVFAEFLPTSLIVFYVAFLTAYHVLSQDRAQAQLQSSMLDAELEQSRTELETLRRVQAQTAVYQHDMRHHLTMVEGYLSADRPEQAAEYVRQVLSRSEHTTLHRYCGNDTVNLLCSAFADRANQAGVRLDVDASLPQVLPIPDKMRKTNNFNQKDTRGLSFEALQLVGLDIDFIEDPSYRAHVISDKEVEFEGKKWRLSPLTKEIQMRRGKVNASGSYQGAWWWEYDGIRLYDIIY